MTSSDDTSRSTLKVIDAMDHPHGGRILRTRLLEGTAPTMKALKGTSLRAHAPRGPDTAPTAADVDVKVSGFPLFGGRPSDDRIGRTGRVDLVVTSAPGVEEVDRDWILSVP